MNRRATHFGAEEVDLTKVRFTAELLACVPAAAAKRYRVLPIGNLSDKLLLAIADPSDLNAIDSLHDLLQRDIELCVAESWQIDDFLVRLYGGEGNREG